MSLISGLARGDNGNFILGYNNTEVLVAFNNDPDNSSWPLESIGLLEDFRESNPLPETTSGWYMPSVKELSIMCDGPSDYNIFWGARTFSNRNVINASMSEIEGAELLGEAEKRYWSSTEKLEATKSFFLDFNIGLAPSGLTRNNSITNRFVFAF